MDDDKTTSKTEQEQFIEKGLVGLPPHYKTTISDGEKTVERRGSTPEEAEKRASEEWDKKDDD